MIILAIDPGITGALAFLDTHQLQRVAVFDMPIINGDVDERKLRDLIQPWKPEQAVIERASSRPKQGVAGVWRFSAAYTTACVVVRLLDIHLTIVTPAKWKKAMNLSGGKEGKEQARLRARDQFPLCAQHFGRIKDHGRAEAALLALHHSQWPYLRMVNYAETQSSDSADNP